MNSSVSYKKKKTDISAVKFLPVSHLILHFMQAYKANVICPNKHQSDPEKFYKNHLLESETYIGGHVECLESGVFRSDLPTSFKLDASAYEVCFSSSFITTNVYFYCFKSTGCSVLINWLTIISKFLLWTIIPLTSLLIKDWCVISVYWWIAYDWKLIFSMLIILYNIHNHINIYWIWFIFTDSICLKHIITFLMVIFYGAMPYWICL